MSASIGLIISGIFVISLAFYRDLMDQSFSSKYNERVTWTLRWGGSLMVVLGGAGALIEVFG